MTTAEVSMKPVATHSICSWSTPNVLIMCGSATFTMLESSTAMNVPSMMMPSTSQRLARRLWSLVMRGLAPRRRPRVYAHLDRKARTDRQVGRRRDRNAQGHALRHLDEGPGHALGGDQAELGVGGPQDLGDAPVQAKRGEGVDRDVRGVADRHIVEVLLLDV